MTLLSEQARRYRFTIDIDGFGFSARTPLLFFSRRVVFLPWPPVWPQFFFRPNGGLQPMRHFVPVERDLSNLKDQIEWCLQNAPRCEAIAKSGFEYARSNLRHGDVVSYVSDTLNALRLDATEMEAEPHAELYMRWVADGRGHNAATNAATPPAALPKQGRGSVLWRWWYRLVRGVEPP